MWPAMCGGGLQMIHDQLKTISPLVSLQAPILVLLTIGLFSMLIHSFFSTSDCINIVIQSTTAAVWYNRTATEVWQWLWVLCSCCVSACVTILLVRLQPYGSRLARKKSRLLRMVWACFTDGGEVNTWSAINEWRFSMRGSTKISASRVMLIRLLHLPVLFIAGAPACAYVLAVNVSSGKEWYIAMWSIFLVITVAKLLVSKIICPLATAKLAEIKYGVVAASSLKLVRGGRCVTAQQAQANSLLVFNVVAVLIASVVAVSVLDESCLRYYLRFSEDLKSLMDTWGVGQLGADAYRQQFCSRTLVTHFSWIWITLLLFATFLSPVLSLVNPIRKLKELLKTGCTQCIDQNANRTPINGPEKFRKEAVEYRCEIVGIYMILLVIIVFGRMSPLLLALAPLFTFSKTCAINWRTLGMRQMDSLDVIHQRIAHSVTVQHPFKMFSIFAVFGQWLVAATLFVDLQFQIGPIVLYVTFWFWGICFLICYKYNLFLQRALPLTLLCQSEQLPKGRHMDDDIVLFNCNDHDSRGAVHTVRFNTCEKKSQMHEDPTHISDEPIHTI